MPPPNETVFVTKKITNRMIYDEVCSLQKRIDNFKWHIRGLWGCMGLFATALMLFASHIIK
jgi:hypothetical protein